MQRTNVKRRVDSKGGIDIEYGHRDGVVQSNVDKIVGVEQGLIDNKMLGAQDTIVMKWSGSDASDCSS